MIVRRLRAAISFFVILALGVSTIAIAGCASKTPGLFTPGELDPEAFERGDLLTQNRPDQIIVALPLVAPTILMDTIRHLARQYEMRPVMRGFPLPTIGFYCAVFELEPETDVDELLLALAEHPGVRLAQRNQFFETRTEMHSDPYASMQHGPAEMRIDRAHGVATGSGVRVAIIDTGVDLDHSDLRERIAGTRNFVRGGDSSFSADAHGTAVAGVIAATADDGVGIYGMAPAAEVVVAKACWHGEGNSSGAVKGSSGGASVGARCSSWTLALALDYAIESGARVLNLSLGGPPDLLLTKLLANAHAKSIVIVAAAGRSASSPRFPASLDFVIAVVDEAFEEDSGDERQTGVHQRNAKVLDRVVAAPGQEILTTAPGDRYHFRSGSSISAAHITGLVALLLERDPSLTPERIHDLLEATSRRSGPSDVVGLADACAALSEVDDSVRCL